MRPGHGRSGRASEAVRREWVLTKGDVLHEDRTGAEHVQPGCWVARVRDEKVVSVMFFRTEDEALAALGGD